MLLALQSAFARGAKIVIEGVAPDDLALVSETVDGVSKMLTKCRFHLNATNMSQPSVTIIMQHMPLLRSQVRAWMPLHCGKVIGMIRDHWALHMPCTGSCRTEWQLIRSKNMKK